MQLSKSDLEVALARVQESDLRTPLADVTLKAPIDWQEVWCAGVTYLRSRDARMEESQSKSVYDRSTRRIARAFFKGMRFRVAGRAKRLPFAVTVPGTCRNRSARW